MTKEVRDDLNVLSVCDHENPRCGQCMDSTLIVAVDRGTHGQGRRE